MFQTNCHRVTTKQRLELARRLQVASDTAIYLSLVYSCIE